MGRKMELAFLFMLHSSAYNKMMKKIDLLMQIWKRKEMLVSLLKCSLQDLHFFQTVQFLEFSKYLLLTPRKMENERFFFLSVHIWK